MQNAWCFFYAQKGWYKAMADTPKQGLASIGLDIKIGKTALNYATKIGDIGGTHSSLDATCFKDKSKKSVPGVQENDSWEVEYLYDNGATTSDYRILKGLENAGAIVDVEVTFPDKTVFKNKGYVTTTVTGAEVNNLIKAKAVVNLQGEWEVTDPVEA